MKNKKYVVVTIFFILFLFTSITCAEAEIENVCSTLDTDVCTIEGNIISSSSEKNVDIIDSDICPALILKKQLIDNAVTSQIDNQTHVYFFWSLACPHCKEEKPFLETLEQKYTQLNVHSYEISQNQTNLNILKQVAKAYEKELLSVPITVIGDEFIIGYNNDATTGKLIHSKIKSCIETGCPDPFVKAGLKQIPYDDSIICAAVFVKSSCPHCQAILPVIKSIKQSYNLEFPIHNVEGDNHCLDILNIYKKRYQIETITGFPIAFVSDTYLIGEKQITKYFETEVKNCLKNNCLCPIDPISASPPYIPGPGEVSSDKKIQENVTICPPIIGCITFTPGQTNLLYFTLLIGIVDGVNPCTMWVLSFLLGLLLYTGSRRRIIFVGLVYLATVYSVYFLFMVAWLETFKIIQYINTIRITIGVLAILAGLINIKDFFHYGKGISLVIPKRFKPFLIKQMRNLTKEESKWALISGSFFLAAAASLIELPCTAGFPIIYTQILISQAVSMTTYYLYIALYCVIYIIPDTMVLIIFLIFMSRKRKFTEKEGRWLKLFGGIIMFVLGIIMLLKPELLQFS